MLSPADFVSHLIVAIISVVFTNFVLPALLRTAKMLHDDLNGWETDKKITFTAHDTMKVIYHGIAWLTEFIEGISADPVEF